MAERALRRVAHDGVDGVRERVLAGLDALVERMGAAYRAEIPEYAALPAAVFADEVLPVSRTAVTLFFDLAADRSPTARDLRPFVTSGRSRQDRGVPLEAVLHAYRIAGRETWTAVVAAVGPGDEHLLADLAARWIDYVDRISSAVAASYVEAGHERLRALDARRRELVEALLTATDAADVAAVGLRFSTALAPSYVPVLVTGTDVAARIDALLNAAPARTLGGHRSDGARVLLLVPDALPATSPLLAARDDDLVVWGRAAAPGSALLAEVGAVERVARAARAVGRSGGVVGPEDLLAERLLLADPATAGALVHRLSPVSDAALIDTLAAYIASGSVPSTARELLVHANTVAYRLGRIRELTGLDPRVPADAATLTLALAAHRLQKVD
ncbi:MAG TPA: helix-turn-helix domain-containing protein [Mycobacteriales bacterium]|nr:helix-turn-helix domain-containing protein [Mycobacteriales bacterium]